MSIGAILKDARSKKEITLEDVHSKIKIHPRVLQLLEEDKFEKLPSPLFAKSFLKSYAEFLGVNVDELVRAYEKEARKEPEQVLFIKPAAARDAAAAGFDKKYLLIPGLVLGVILAAFIFAWAVGAVIGYTSKAVHGHRTSAKAAPAAAPRKEKTSAPKEAPAAKKSADWLRSVDMGDFPKINKRVPIDLQIRALENVWLRVSSDEQVLYEGIVKRGEAKVWQAKAALEVWTGNASNMAMTVNHTAIGSPGKGLVKRMVVTREGVKISPKEKS